MRSRPGSSSRGLRRRRACSATSRRTARAARARPLPRLHEQRQAGLPRARGGRRLRNEPRPLPRRQRAARPADPQPLREAGRRHDAADVRLRRGLDGRPRRRGVLPLDVPAAEQRQQRVLPRDAAAAAGARDARRARDAERARARVFDAAPLALSGRKVVPCGDADELRAAVVHAQGGPRVGSRQARRAASARLGGAGLRLRLPERRADHKRHCRRSLVRSASMPPRRRST